MCDQYKFLTIEFTIYILQRVLKTFCVCRSFYVTVLKATLAYTNLLHCEEVESKIPYTIPNIHACTCIMIESCMVWCLKC